MRPPNASSRTDDDPVDIAAAWFAHLHSGHATAEDRRVFEQWKNAHPEHSRQYRNLQQIWLATGHVPQDQLRAILRRREPFSSDVNSQRRRFGIAVGSVCAASLVGGVAVHQGWLESPLHTMEIVSRRGQRHQMSLPDGTVLDVNTGTRALAKIYEHKRVVQLLEGEIFFAVRHDADRRFIVDAGESRIVVTGTRFNVRHDPQQVQVSVQSGSVDVSNGAWWRRRSRSLVSGQGVAVSAGQALGDAYRVDLSTILAWQRGKIVFENTPLEQAVAEINRYLDRPAQLDAPLLRQYRIAGIFSVADPQALIDTLPEFAPVRVYRLPDGRSRIVAI